MQNAAEGAAELPREPVALADFLLRPPLTPLYAKNPD
jgi:hypothetical protein